MSKLIVNNLIGVSPSSNHDISEYWIISPPLGRHKFNFIDKLFRIPFVKIKNHLPFKGWTFTASYQTEYGQWVYDQLVLVR